MFASIPSRFSLAIAAVLVASAAALADHGQDEGLTITSPTQGHVFRSGDTIHVAGTVQDNNVTTVRIDPSWTNSFRARLVGMHFSSSKLVAPTVNQRRQFRIEVKGFNTSGRAIAEDHVRIVVTP
jgi:hypothetical protein